MSSQLGERQEKDARGRPDFCPAVWGGLGVAQQQEGKAVLEKAFCFVWIIGSLDCVWMCKRKYVIHGRLHELSVRAGLLKTDV